MTLQTVLETERLRLTNWHPEHAKDLVRLHGDPEITKHFTPEGGVEDEGRAMERLAHWADLFSTRRLGKLRVTDKRTGAFLGRAGFGVYGPAATPEIGYAFLKENWGKGYASEAAAGLRDWFFEETDGDGFIGFAAIDNHASIHVLQKIGLIPTEIRRIENGLTCQFHELNRSQWRG